MRAFTRRRMRVLAHATSLWLALEFFYTAGFPPFAAAAPGDLSGQWRGRVVLHGDTVEVVLDLGKVGSRWVGECDVPAFGAENYPIEIERADSNVILRFSGVDADYHGKLSGSGKHLDGVLRFPDGETAPGEESGTDSQAGQTVRFVRVGEVSFSAGLLQIEAAAEDSTRVRVLSEDGRELRQRFQAARAAPRLVMLLSPT